MKNLETKQEIRTYHKNLRGQMSAREVEKKSRLICKKILESREYQQTALLYGYYPLGNEVDVLPVLRQALLEGKAVVLPRTGTDCQMEFYRVTSLEQVEEGAFHVMEPKQDCPLVQENTGMMLVPGVVFDKSGSRYGYGKGYYDRYLAKNDKICRISVAYEHQIEEQLEVLPTDQRMQVVCTETAWYRALGKAAR